MPDPYYKNKLYPLQDRVLRWVSKADVDFYLTGGTALGRFYLNHRYSDDLDFFLNQSKDFRLQCDRVLAVFKSKAIQYKIGTVSKSFARVFLRIDDLQLKIDFVNDVAYRYGDFLMPDRCLPVDHWRNILSNKLCALSRLEPRDYADIACIAKCFNFSWEEVIKEARNKDMWVEPITVSRMIAEFPTNKLSGIKWIKPAPASELSKILEKLAKSILTGEENQPDTVSRK